MCTAIDDTGRHRDDDADIAHWSTNAVRALGQTMVMLRDSWRWEFQVAKLQRCNFTERK